MARKKLYQELIVYMNSLEVGLLTREPTGQLVFQYKDSWLDNALTRPISLSMPLTEIAYKGSVVECYFENLLPDSEAIRGRIQKRFNTGTKQCFDLLSHIGGDCVGALQLLDNTLTSSSKEIKALPINDSEIAKLLKNYQYAPLGMQSNSDFRISIAGAQEKTALLWYKNKWCIPQRATPTSHIIKLPIGRIMHSDIDLSESVENEWLCLKILSAFDLPVNKAEIVRFDDVKSLVVERFDRAWSASNDSLIRLPQEDFCQVFSVPPGLKYESDGGPGINSIMDILQNSESTIQDRDQFFKTVFLFWVLGAIDGHAKNFSILLKAQGRFKLTPVYDVISAYPLAEKREVEWKKLKMAMGVKSSKNHYKWDTIQIRHWFEMAKKCHYPEQKMKDIIASIFDQMDSVRQKVESTMPDNFPQQISESIFNGMQKIKNRCQT